MGKIFGRGYRSDLGGDGLQENVEKTIFLIEIMLINIRNRFLICFKYAGEVGMERCFTFIQVCNLHKNCYLFNYKIGIFFLSSLFASLFFYFLEHRNLENGGSFLIPHQYIFF